MRFISTRMILISLMLSGFFFWTLAQSDTTQPLKTKSGFHFKMKQVEKGRYLVKKIGCNDCHTTGYLQSKGNVPESKWLTGDTVGWRGPMGTTYGENLRVIVNNLSKTEWVKMSKTLKSRPPMPHYILNAMPEKDLEAIYEFIRYLGP